MVHLVLYICTITINDYIINLNQVTAFEISHVTRSVNSQKIPASKINTDLIVSQSILINESKHLRCRLLKLREV